MIAQNSAHHVHLHTIRLCSSSAPYDRLRKPVVRSTPALQRCSNATKLNTVAHQLNSGACHCCPDGMHVVYVASMDLISHCSCKLQEREVQPCRLGLGADIPVHEYHSRLQLLSRPSFQVGLSNCRSKCGEGGACTATTCHGQMEDHRHARTMWANIEAEELY